MPLDQAAQGRRARSVCIVTRLPVRLQDKSAPQVADVSSRVVRLQSATLIITESATGEISIKIEPP